MNIRSTTTALALGISGAVSIGTATAAVPEAHYMSGDNSIISVNGPDLKVTVYDGIATVVGTASSVEEAKVAEQEIGSVPGIEHVINLITWG